MNLIQNSWTSEKKTRRYGLMERKKNMKYGMIEINGRKKAS